MPRERRKKKKETKVPKSKPAPKEELTPLEACSLDQYHSFMKAHDDIIAISYQVPTANLAKDGLVSKYRGEMITAIQNFARKKGQIVSVQHISIDVLPMGSETIIKAWAHMRDVDGKVKRRDSTPEDPMDWSVKAVET